MLGGNLAGARLNISRAGPIYTCYKSQPLLLQEGFSLSSSPRLHGRGAGQNVIPPEVRWLQTEGLPIQAIWHGPSY